MASPSSLPEPARIWLLLQHRRYKLAEDAARQRLAANPAEGRTYVLLADALRLLDRLEEARLAAADAVRFAPESATAHFVLARVHGQQGNFEKAHEATIKALRLNPGRADYHGFRAQLFYLRRSYNAAIGCAEDGLRLDARHTDCLLWRALAQEAKDQPEAADEDFRRLLHLAPDSAMLHNRLGRVLLRRYEPHQADIHLTTALRQQPEQAAELVPLIRQARERQLWPAWLLRSEQRGAARRALGLDPGLGMLLNRIRGVGAVTRAWWRTRHDPLFQLSHRQRWRLRLGLWLAIIPILAALLFLGDSIGLFDTAAPLSMPQMVSLLAGGGVFHLVIYLMKRQIDSQTPR